MNIRDIRQEYTLGGMDDSYLGANPIDLFDRWFREAVNAGINEPSAMALSTLGTDGYPQSRIVLLKGYGEEGFSFFTNYESQKGNALAQYPKASLLFFWPELQRQIRITGKVEKTSVEESEEYFRSRPRGSRLGAWTSEQSQEIPSRKTLEERYEVFDRKFPEEDIPKPPHWGGYRLTPLTFEFWQGRENRLHDRISFRKENGKWKTARLAP
ncbi:pyridoxamine 5'-phosphate oxidase [Bacteroidales bacterium 6E]|nr:pyridoxamine 5'-phosphate oxidase [Bacteroidales bacterium 6E]